MVMSTPVRAQRCCRAARCAEGRRPASALLLVPAVPRVPSSPLARIGATAAAAAAAATAAAGCVTSPPAAPSAPLLAAAASRARPLGRRPRTVRQRHSGGGGAGAGAALVVVLAAGSAGGGGGPAAGGAESPGAFGSARRRSRRSAKPGTAAPSAPGSGTTAGGGGGGGVAPGGGASHGPSPSPVSSPVPPPSPGGGGSGGGVLAAAAAGAAVTVAVKDAGAAAGLDGGESDYEATPLGGNHIVPFARRQPRALVLDCAYRPINVLTWYKAFHFEYFGKGEVLEYYPPPAVCTTGSGDFPLPAVLRVPQYTADMQDLCSRVACSRRNVMVRDGFCCQYCGSRRDLTIDHVLPVSRGGRDAWENLVTACMRCNQRKSDRTLRELGWKLRRQPREPTSYEIGIVAGISTSDILRPPPEWEAYIAPYRERLEMYRRAAVEAGLANMIDDDDD